MDQYEERWKETNNKSNPTSAQNTPTISVHTPLDFGPWRDEHGLLMEGLSDFYDFTASVNPSRSRSTSRNPSPANTAPNTPLPKDVSFQLEMENEDENERSTVEVYDDTGDLESQEFKKENIIKFINSLNGNDEDNDKEISKEDEVSNTEENFKHPIQLVADDADKPGISPSSLVPLVNIVEESSTDVSVDVEITESQDGAMNILVSSLRTQQAGRSRSRSKSPLPTADNLKRSVENRRYKMIKHNEDILEKLIESKLLPELTPQEQEEQKIKEENEEAKRKEAEAQALKDAENSSREQMDSLVQSLRVDRGRSRSKSPMRLPTPENLNKGLEKRRSKLIERNDELIKTLEERSQTPESPKIAIEYVYEMEGSEETSSANISSPTITIETAASETPSSPEDDCSREKMDLLVQSLRVAQSRSRSKSPMVMQQSITATHFQEFQKTEHMEVIQQTQMMNTPTISINFAETEPETREIEITETSKQEDEEQCSRAEMDSLVQSLRMARSRSASKSPMPQHIQERAKTPEPSSLTVEYVYEFEKSEEQEHDTSRFSRSRTPSRSPSRSRSRSLPPNPNEMELAAYRSKTPSRSVSPQSELQDEFHILLNLEGSHNKTLTISSEEQESINLAERQRQLDEEALEKIINASEETELRTLSPLILDKDELSEQQGEDLLSDLPITEKAKLLRKSPTTPDYDRTISEEMRDIARIKQDMLEKGFKRSTYVGESMDLGREFEELRKETALFQRSASPSPSTSFIDSEAARKRAKENRKLQDIILQQLTTTTGSENASETQPSKSTGAIPKTERSLRSSEIEITLTTEHQEESISITEEYEEMRRKNAEFRRSGSASRSPLQDSQLQELAKIDAEAAKRELKDKVLHEISCNAPRNFQDFSKRLNSDFFDSERRASDSALIQKPEILLQLNNDTDIEPEEYHHFRRFSLAQEQPIEQYPSDEYIFVEEVEVRTRSGSRTWVKEDFYSEEVEEKNYKTSEKANIEVEETSESKASSRERDNIEIAEVAAQEPNENEEGIVADIEDDDEDEYSNASDDRQTVVEVDDEIDEDISDFNERGPAEESHHETSECEEAEREMDRYAGREASDWNRVVDVDDIIVENRANELITSEEEEGAVGGLSNSPYDSDSFAIDQIYDEAIKNRKQSGILREYDSILMQMSVGSDVDEQYLLWSKTKSKKKPKNVEFNTQFLDERKESEMRYLGDANVTARQSTRLRSRYGYNPVLQTKTIEDDVEVDLNYKPKREYNWRKNFKLDDEDIKEDKEIQFKEMQEEMNKEDEENREDNFNENEEPGKSIIDKRKYSLGGESVTLFSRSPERSLSITEESLENNEQQEILMKEEVKEEKLEKPKKKKTKKKLHKESKGSLEETMNKEDEEAYDIEVNQRRSSSIQMETDSPKRKSRSRRSSKSSITNEDSMGLFSPRTSITYAEGDIMEEIGDMPKESGRPKKMKKRKKVKESMANVAESPIEQKEEFLYNLEPLNDIATISAVITPNSASANILSTLSPQNSICVTPGSIDVDLNVEVELEESRESSKDTNTTNSSTTASSPAAELSRTSSIVTTPVDTFDILKDANFYPLF